MRPNHKNAPAAQSSGEQRKALNQKSKTPLQRLQSRLNNWRQTGSNQYMASCPGPTHRRGDINPSLSIGELADGTLLLNCFGNCETEEVLQSLSLEICDLFPDSPENRRPIPKSQRWDYRALLKQLRYEATLVTVAAKVVRDGALTDEDRARLDKAVIRIAKIAELAE